MENDTNQTKNKENDTNLIKIPEKNETNFIKIQDNNTNSTDTKNKEDLVNNNETNKETIVNNNETNKDPPKNDNSTTSNGNKEEINKDPMKKDNATTPPITNGTNDSIDHGTAISSTITNQEKRLFFKTCLIEQIKNFEKISWKKNNNF